jgi:O-methyltransferase
VLKLVVPRKIRLSKPALEQDRLEGHDWPLLAQTMAGMKRLDHLQHCVETILADGIPGDFIETGVWRGGSSIFMRAVLKAHDVGDRMVWVADSFQGLPAPDASKYPADAGDEHYTKQQLAISLETVKGNFERYDLLDDQVRFLKGWFKDTLPAAPIEKLALVRLDGDLYESTLDALNSLYPKLQPGGFLVIDDYGALANCRQAVHDYRDHHGITEPIERIDWTGAFWRRNGPASAT